MNIDIDKIDFNILIDSLPEDELEIFCLYYSPNMSYKKVGDIKGISATRVRQKLAKGHRRIRRTMSKKLPEMYDDMIRACNNRHKKWIEKRDRERNERLDKEGEKIHVYYHTEETWINKARHILSFGNYDYLFTKDVIEKAMNGDVESINLCMKRIVPLSGSIQSRMYDTNSIVYYHKSY
jgi:hypothetical protein